MNFNHKERKVESQKDPNSLCPSQKPSYLLRTTIFESFRSLRKFSIGGTNHKERIEHKK